MLLRITAAGLLVAAFSLTGCGRSSRSEKLIQNLGGNPAEQKRAVMELRLSSDNIVPDLIRAIANRRTKPRIRLEALGVLGDTARRQKSEEAMKFLVEVLESDDAALQLKAVQELEGLDYEAAIPKLVNVRQSATGEVLQVVGRTIDSIAVNLKGAIEQKWRTPATAEIEYQHAFDLGLNRGVMGYSYARFLEHRGRRAEADAYYDGLGVFRKYWIIGTYPNRQGAGLTAEYPPEKEIDIDKVYKAGSEEKRWHLIEQAIPNGMLNFENYFVEINHVVGYAMVGVHSEKEIEAEIRAGSDDTINIYFNGEEVWANGKYRAAQFDDDIVPVTLQQGENILLFKVCEDWGGWMLTARITGPGDTPLTGVAPFLPVPKSGE